LLDLFLKPEDKDRTFLRNVDKIVANNTVSRPMRLHSHDPENLTSHVPKFNQEI
jgi:hypothetical protein